MAGGLGATIITFTPNETIRSADANANNAALNSASTYQFTTCQIIPSLTPDNTFRGLEMITATDFGLLSNTSSNFLRLQAGLTATSQVAVCDLSGNAHIGFWTDGTYDYIRTGLASFRLQTNGNSSPANTLRATSTNAWNISGTNYGFITAANATFNQGTGNADIAEPLLTQGNPEPGMAVCCVASDTVAPCTHSCCRVAKIVSTSPTILLTPRIHNDEEMTPIEGHESAMAIVVGGVAPLHILNSHEVKLRDRVTPDGNAPGWLRVARDDEYALGDVVRIENGVVYAWIHY